ncbi:ligase [GDP-forming] subunit beta, mitochondrial [Seminavis robusta]|uniref:Succinyl-CoA synthetase beta chain n=1 Tax=Seminavis robusta TaxID=568900 RepID=A0A9N8D9D1_9STRA|nr:ligase [GDP-forming] subunit beta, mitochondrial [Seminavis robusta]|eukprot:Sro46_g027350.1 ligase [GDP-forming] subunit beta, mitochondrial (420) ;mRNA; r:28411-29816
MELMRSYNLPTPTCYTATTPADAEQIYRKLNPPDKANNKDAAAIIKAQVLTGGRGKGHFDNGFQGGVKFLKSPLQARQVASHMLGANLITKQAPNGLPCHKVLLRECFDLDRELYLSIISDPKSGGPLLVASPCGGTSIEEVAETHPEFIFTQSIDIGNGITDEQCHNVAFNLGFPVDSPLYDQCVQLAGDLYHMYTETDSLQVEINPLAETPQGKLIVADAKVVIDDRAKDRHPHIFAQRDFSQEDPREVHASRYCFNYVAMDGNVGCLVNGAGLSMATMDLLERNGGTPACFLDVGGSAESVSIDGAFDVLDCDDSVKAIFVNIFGGIVRCDLIAKVLITSFQKGKVNKPTVVRLVGNHAELALELLQAANIPMLTVELDWDTAAHKVVEIANECEQPCLLTEDEDTDDMLMYRRAE